MQESILPSKVKTPTLVPLVISSLLRPICSLSECPSCVFCACDALPNYKRTRRMIILMRIAHAVQYLKRVCESRNLFSWVSLSDQLIFFFFFFEQINSMFARNKEWNELHIFIFIYLSIFPSFIWFDFLQEEHHSHYMFSGLVFRIQFKERQITLNVYLSTETSNSIAFQFAQYKTPI